VFLKPGVVKNRFYEGRNQENEDEEKKEEEVEEEEGA
jgi:hypothetical protein